MQNTIQKKSYAGYIVKLVIGLFLIFVFGYVCPPWGGIKTAGIQAIGIFFGLIFLISVSDFGLILPALLGFFALILTKQYTPTTLMAATFGNTTVVQIIFVYVLCQAIIATGAGEFIAKWLLTRKSLQGRPYLFGFVFLFAALIMGALVGIGGIIFIFALLDSIVTQLNYEVDGSFNKWMSLGAFLAACIGMAFIPFQGLPLVIFGSILTAMQQNGIFLNYATYMFVIIAFCLIFITIFALIMKMVKVDMSKLKSLDLSKMSNLSNAKMKMTRKQKIACLTFLIGIAYSIVNVFLDKNSALFKLLANFDQCTWFILVLALFFMFREEGKPLLNEEKTFRDGISWSIVLTVCVFTVIGGMLASPTLGVRTWLNNILTPVFTGMPFPVFMLLICAVSAICTNFFANAAVGLIVGTLTMPFALTYSKTIGINISVYGAAVTLSAMYAYLTMAASGYAPLFLTRPCIQKDQKFLWGVGGVMLILGILLMTVIFTIFAYIL